MIAGSVLRCGITLWSPLQASFRTELREIEGKIMKIQIAVTVIVAMAILVGPDAASSTGATTVEGNIEDVFDLSVDITHAYLSLLNTGYSLQLPANLIVTSNGPWQVTVKSDHPQGKMSEWNPTDGYLRFHPWAYKELYLPMHVEYFPMNVQLTDQDQVLIPQNNNYGTNVHYPIAFAQTTSSSYGDSRVDPPDVYRIVVTFTGSMSY